MVDPWNLLIVTPISSGMLHVVTYVEVPCAIRPSIYVGRYVGNGSVLTCIDGTFLVACIHVRLICPIRDLTRIPTSRIATVVVALALR